jgi:hypothetical protein
MTPAPSKKPTLAEGKDNIAKEERIFSISGNNKGLWCPFKPLICQQEGNCHRCQIYLDWQKLGEMVVICAWCGQVISRKPGLVEPVVSHGICLKCQQEYFPKYSKSIQKYLRG